MEFDFASDLGVSRETIDRLKVLEKLVLKWSKTINLISRGDQHKIWERHIVDSLQIYPLLPKYIKNYVDFGSGGGFPGFVLSILLNAADLQTSIHLVESDKRKSAFLRTVNRELSLNVRVYGSRIEGLKLQQVDVITARALAPLDILLGLSSLHINKNTICIFPKGKNWKKEVKKAQKQWKFDLEVIKSKTQVGAVVLKVGSISSAMG